MNNTTAQTGILPPRAQSASQLGQDRIFRTALSPADYLNLETEAIERGMKAFTLSKSVLSLYVNKRLLLVSDLPKHLQDQINGHYANTT